MGRSENESHSSLLTFNNVKDHSKFILLILTLAVGLGSFIINYYLTIYPVTEQTAGIVIKFTEEIDKNWIRELQAYINKKIDTYSYKWNNGTSVTNVSRCVARCNYDSYHTDIFYDNSCTTRPVYVDDRIVTEELLLSMTYAEATMPCFLKLAISRIPNANRGIFTTKYKIPNGLFFGPYTGRIIPVSGEEGQIRRDYRYAWLINRPDRVSDFYIDGIDESNSNWLRYINSARYEEEQNMVALLFNNTVYYMTVKDVEPDTELLIWYGYEYAKYLKIFVIPSSAHDWMSIFAPPVNETTCPTCPKKNKLQVEDEMVDGWLKAFNDVTMQ